MSKGFACQRIDFPWIARSIIGVEHVIPLPEDPVELKKLVASLREVIESQDRLLAEQDKLQLSLQEQMKTLQKQLKAALERIAELEARLNKNSSNSSRPPSSDPPWLNPQASRKKSTKRRKPGGQKGHKGKARDLLPPQDVDHIEEYRPQKCKGCGRAFNGSEPVVGEPHRHQVAELPPILVEIWEHRRLPVKCPCCDTVTMAPWPEDVPKSPFGPRLQAAIAYLCGRQRMSRRGASEVSEDMFGTPMSVGSVQGCCESMGSALEEPVVEAEQKVRQAGLAHVDETGWKEAGAKRWLWVVVTAFATVFRIANTRGSKVVKGLLGWDFSGVLVTDRWSAYNLMKRARRQLCWAHLSRDFQALIDRGGVAASIGEWAHREMHTLFHLWHRYRDGEIGAKDFRASVALVKARFKLLLLRGQEVLEPKKGKGLCKKLLKHWSELWTFTEMDGVEPTNNIAERALRPAVQWRKGSQGTRSKAGSLFVERMLTACATCRQHGRPVLGYLVDVCRAAMFQRPVPSLPFAPETLDAEGREQNSPDLPLISEIA